MKVDLKSANLEITAAISDAVQKRLDTFDAIVERFGTSVTAEVEVGRTTHHHNKGDVFRAEVHVRLPGKLVYAEATNEDLYVALNDACKDAERQILNHKGKMTDARRRVAKKD